MNHYTFHILNQVFPVMPDEDLAQLGKDILANGLRQPITLYDGQILDGKNRYLAARLVGAQLHVDNFHTFDGDLHQAKEYLIDVNLNRRSLTPAQRAHITAAHAKLRADRTAANPGTPA